MPDKELSLGKLEQTLEQLEQLVEKLEQGELPLNEAVKEFERGIRLTKQCQSVLRQAEQKIEVLLTDSETPAAFEAEAD